MAVVSYVRESTGDEWVVVRGLPCGRPVRIRPLKAGGVSLSRSKAVPAEVFRREVAAALGSRDVAWDALVAASGRLGLRVAAANGGVLPTTAPYVARDADKLRPVDARGLFPDGVEILVDTREPPAVAAALSALPGVTVVRRALPVGDYALAAGLVVERKTAVDLDASLSAADGRMLSQVSRLGQLAGARVIVVEGAYGSRRWPLGRLTGVLAGFAALEGVSVLPSLSPVHTAHLVAHLAAHVLRGGRHAPGLWPSQTAPARPRRARGAPAPPLPPSGTGDLFAA